MRKRKIESLVGERFGRLVVKELGDRDKWNHIRWTCTCDCGKTRLVRRDALMAGNTTSCGCLQKERVTTHGMKGTSEYNAWASMKARCTNPNATGYRHYGGRGVKVCDRWLNSFENFFEDTGERPEGMSFDRVNNEGDYEPSNWRWATASQQQTNKRMNPRNTSGHCGVSWYKITRQWVAVFVRNGRRHHVGYFRDKKDAIEAYDKAIREYKTSRAL